MSAEEGLLANPMVWYSVSTAMFVFLIAKIARKPIVSAMDAQIEKIKNDLAEAGRLRKEAEEALVSYREREQEAFKEAEQIVAQAKADADNLRKEAQVEIENLLVRQEEKARMRIEAARDDAVTEIRAMMAHQAIEKATHVLKDKMTDKSVAALADKAIEETVQAMPKGGKVA